MKFAVATVDFWISVGLDPTNWRKSLDGKKAICHVTYAEKKGINLYATPGVDIYDSVDTDFEILLRSSEWTEKAETGDPDSFSLLNELNRFETKINTAVSQKTTETTNLLSPKIEANKQDLLAAKTQLEQKTEKNKQDIAKTDTKLEGYITTNDKDKLSLTTQLQQYMYDLKGLPSGETLDASDFIQSILSQAKANNVKKVTFPKNVYRLNKPIYTNGSDLEIDFSGSTILSYANAEGNKRAEIGIINVHGNTVEEDVDVVTYLRSLYPGQHIPPANSPVLFTFETINRNISRITTSNNNYFSEGDEILLNGWTRPEGFPYSSTKFEPELHVLAKVLSVNSDYVDIDYSSPFEYPTFVNNAVFKSRAHKVNTVKNVTIKNVKIIDMTEVSVRGNMTSTEQLQATCGISPMLVDGFTLENVTVENHRSPAIYPYCTRNLDFKNIHGEKPQSWEVGGYTICFMTSRDIVAEKITGNEVRHTVDFSTCSNNARIYDSAGINTFSTTFSNHGQCEHDIYYFNSRGTLGFGSSLVQFPQINANYTFENCDISPSTTIDGSKWVNNVRFIGGKVKVGSNPSYLGLTIIESEVDMAVSNHQPTVNTRDVDVDTHFILENVNLNLIVNPDSFKLVYNVGYDTFKLDGVTITLDETGFVGTTTFVMHNIKNVILNNVESDRIRFRYSNNKHTKVKMKLNGLVSTVTSGYFLLFNELKNCEVFLIFNGSKVENTGETINYWYVVDGSTGTRENARLVGSIHDNHFKGNVTNRTHNTYLESDTIYTHDNIVEHKANGSKFTEKDYIIS